MTRSVCTADIPEQLPEIPECDLLLIYRLGETEIINAAYVDNDDQPVNPLVEVEL